MASSDADTFHWHYTDFDDNTYRIRGRTLFFLVLLFCCFILVTLIYLYARWVCRIRPPSGSRLTHAPPQEGRGLDLCAIGSLPIVLHRAAPANSGEAECPICLGMFEDGEKVKVLPRCKHCYHSECVDSWLRTQSSCPLCRASLRVDSPV